MLCHMNVTVSIADELASRAREVARREGTTLNDIIRRHLETVAGRRTGATLAKELRKLWVEHPGHSGGRKVARDEAYEGRT
jgi:uncharacterized protein (DUF2267 family)